MDVVIELENLPEIEIGAEGLAEILQNVRIILTTPVGSVPLDRDFGVSWMFIDQPTPKAMAEAKVEIVEKLERYEPRVKVTEVSFVKAPRDAEEGCLFPRVRIMLKEIP